jgi:SAM-dependent methyltransferase
MPVHFDLPSEGMIYQRSQYNKGGIGRRYWDYRDRIVMSYILDGDVKILDIGCGEGITLEKLTKISPNKSPVGIDLAWENITICTSIGLPAIYGSAYNLPFADEYFDVCLMLESIEHMDQPEHAINEAHRVVKYGGKLVAVTPHDRNFLLSRLMTLKIKEAYYDPGHLKVWHPQELRNLFDHCGFTVLHQINIPFVFWQMSLHHLIVGQKIPKLR